MFKSVLFLCVNNSARSQMAEGLARQIFGPAVQVQSAGSNKTAVSPFAIRALAELGIDCAAQFSKSVMTIDPDGVDTVITLCAEEVCPTGFSGARQIHWALPDPGHLPAADDEERLQRFREIRDEIARRLRLLSLEP